MIVLVLAWCWEGFGFVAYMYCEHICFLSLFMPLFMSSASIDFGLGINDKPFDNILFSAQERL